MSAEPPPPQPQVSPLPSLSVRQTLANSLGARDKLLNELLHQMGDASKGGELLAEQRDQLITLCVACALPRAFLAELTHVVESEPADEPEENGEKGKKRTAPTQTVSFKQAWKIVVEALGGMDIRVFPSTALLGMALRAHNEEMLRLSSRERVL